MTSFINNNWIVSLVSILVAFAATPLLQRVSEWIRSRRGNLTGTYLALTQTYDKYHLLAEVVECRHIGDLLKGTISVRAEFSLNRNGEIEPSVVPAALTYRFVGRMRGRQVLLNYWSTAKASQNGGTMTMMLGSNGLVFRGLWCGTATDEQVRSNPCLWIRDTSNSIKDAEVIPLTQFAEGELDAFVNPWRKAQGRQPYSAKLIEDGSYGAEGARKRAEAHYQIPETPPE